MLARFGLMLITNVVGIALYRPLDGRRGGSRPGRGQKRDGPFHPAALPHAASTARAHAAPAATAWSFCHFFDIVS
jgi:hypothetical protein